MTPSVETYPTIWNRSGTSRVIVRPLMRRLWRGMIRLAEAQCAAHERRGFLPYS
ncbi:MULTISPECIES: hypothetical protein [unclassified Halomonas]|uniref:hypothetical protein n=1 Tax=unclassified Halomonas TaxID=2609666 RepID=UPI0003B8CCDC|nr:MULTISPECIES: hypothetical protein [unclassified Halomonas]ERS88948.1 hypothetical protein Q671_06455 [Halomonas sp. PBN3]